MEFLKISAVILISVILISSLPTFDKSVSSLITISVCVLVLSYVVATISPVIESLQILLQSKTDNDLSIVFKTMGISLITQFVSDVASDNGNKALANQMIFVGKVAIVILALPVFTQVLEIIGKLII